MTDQTLLWIIFGAVIVVMLALDLAVFNRRSHEIKIREAFAWSLFWILLALAFNLVVYFWCGSQTALEYFTAYLIEKSLSVDNLFVFLAIFSYFAVKKEHQHKVLFWGILGVLIMRGIFIFVGVALISRLHWLIYVFGAFLILTALKLAFRKDSEIHPEKNPVLRIIRSFLPVTADYENDRFFVRRLGRLMVTPLFVVVMVVETTDVMFTVDSIPAVMGITLDPFVIFTSNIFAVLGMRALFFVLAGFMGLFHHLNYGLAAVLGFVGIKMVISDFYHVPIGVALAVIALILATSVITSIIWPDKKGAA